MTISRAVVRTRVRQLIESALGADVQAVYDHLPADWQNQSPVVMIGSAGSDRRQLTFRGGQVGIQLDVFVFVLAAGSDWTEAQAETQLDHLEASLAVLVRAHQTDEIGGWGAIDYREASTVDFVPDLGGVEYRRERIPLTLTYYQ